ncbi:hypothetical protein COBT_001786 [Conglomerata obtusa]
MMKETCVIFVRLYLITCQNDFAKALCNQQKYVNYKGQNIFQHQEGKALSVNNTKKIFYVDEYEYTGSSSSTHLDKNELSIICIFKLYDNHTNCIETFFMLKNDGSKRYQANKQLYNIFQIKTTRPTLRCEYKNEVQVVKNALYIKVKHFLTKTIYKKLNLLILLCACTKIKKQKVLICLILTIQQTKFTKASKNLKTEKDVIAEEEKMAKTGSPEEKVKKEAADVQTDTSGKTASNMVKSNDDLNSAYIVEGKQKSLSFWKRCKWIWRIMLGEEKRQLPDDIAKQFLAEQNKNEPPSKESKDEDTSKLETKPESPKTSLENDAKENKVQEGQR